VKFPGEAAERVARALLTAGPATAAELADTLGMTTTGVRKHLTSLTDAGLVVSLERAPYGPTPKRGRGRPGHVFALTPEGRAACDQGYDDLALSALRFMSQAFGPAAVEAFASDRAGQLAAAVGRAGGGPASPQEVADALTLAGYAAEVEPLGEVAVQLCQHNCPVVDAAREFPILCETETEALSRALGRHVTRLATLANGDEVCTAIIPHESIHATTSGGTLGKVSA
jgi:predicted ArsR family transcriptional regulator